MAGVPMDLSIDMNDAEAVRRWQDTQMDNQMKYNWGQTTSPGFVPITVNTVAPSAVGGTMPVGMGGGAVNVPSTGGSTGGSTRSGGSSSDLYAIQERKRIAALDAQRKSALSSLKAEEGKINPAFNQALSNVAGTSAVQARNLAEFLSARGLGNSGTAAYGQMLNSSNVVNQQGQLEQQRGDAISDIARRQTEVQSAYDQGSLQAALDRQASSLEAQIAASERARAESIGTVGQYGQDYAAEINAIQAEMARGDNSRAYLLPYLKIARQEKVAGIASSQAEQEQEEWDRWIAMQRLGGSGGGSGGGGSSSVTTTKPTLTAAQARSAYENGVYTDTVLDAYSYHYGVPLSLLGNYQEVERLLQQRTVPSSQVALIEEYNKTGRLSDAQAMELLKKYGLVR